MLKLGSWQAGAIIGALLIIVLFILALLPNLGGPPSTGAEPTAGAIMGQAMGSLPVYVKVWMEFQDYVIAGCLFFILWRKEAQIYALGPVLSHVVFFGLMPLVPLDKLGTGLAALSHWVWIVPLIVLVRAWRGIDLKTGFGVWSTLAIGQLTISLAFDLPEGAMFLLSLLS